MTKINILFDSDKISAIKKAVGAGQEAMRRVYDDPAKAAEAFNAASALAESEGVTSYAVPAEITDSEGNVIASPYSDMDCRAAVAVVGARERNAAGKMESGIRAVVMFPIPTVSAFQEGGESAAKWLDKIAEKEAAHVAFRRLRNAESAEELASAFEAMPTTVDAFVAEYVGEGADTEAFDTLWTPLRNMLKQNQPALVDLLPAKPEVLKAIRSKAYAEQEHGKLEEHGVFVYLARALIGAAASYANDKGEPDPIDSTAIQQWLENRDTYQLPTRTPAEKDFSVLDNINLEI